MKRFFRYIICVALALCIFVQQTQTVSAATKKTAVTRLEPNKVYSINLNGGSSSEKVKFTSTQTYSSGSSKYQFKLYVNGKVIYSLTSKGSYPDVLGAYVYSLDTNTSDKYKEIAVVLFGLNNSFKHMFMFRYINSGNIKKYTYDGRENRVGGITDNTGNNKFYLIVDTPFWNDSFGMYRSLRPVKLSGSKIVRLSVSQYKMHGEFVNNSYKNGYFTLARSMKLYSKASTSSSYSTLKNGSRFKPTHIKCGSKKKAKDQYGHTYTGYNLYVKVKTSSGKTGWLYFPASYTKYLRDEPGWG